MNRAKRATRRKFLRQAAAVTVGALGAACGSTEQKKDVASNLDTPDAERVDDLGSMAPVDASTSVDAGLPPADVGSDAVDASSVSDTGVPDASADVGGTDADEVCELTGPDIEGPFYRSNAPFRTTLIENGEVGRPLQIEGRVLASDCKTPLPGATVDVWHADDEGDYDNASGEFRMRGRMTTNEQGEYAYDTIRPGKYPNAGTFRPEHIHYRVTYTRSNNDGAMLTTQLYFEGDEFIPNDPWASESAQVIALEERLGSFYGVFDIVLPVDAP
jgi:protocatechuate 3,4-dioxygenase beta subunit